LFFERVVAPRRKRADGVLGEQGRGAAPGCDLPGRRFSGFLAELGRMRLGGLGPGAADAGEAVRLVLVGQDARAAERDMLPREAAANRLDRTPAAGRVRGAGKFRLVFHCVASVLASREFEVADCLTRAANPEFLISLPRPQCASAGPGRWARHGERNFDARQSAPYATTPPLAPGAPGTEPCGSPGRSGTSQKRRTHRPRQAENSREGLGSGTIAHSLAFCRRGAKPRGELCPRGQKQ
jgi:hypothetical protein